MPPRLEQPPAAAALAHERIADLADRGAGGPMPGIGCRDHSAQ
jgi:hypothetical protein